MIRDEDIKKAIETLSHCKVKKPKRVFFQDRFYSPEDFIKLIEKYE